MIGAMAQCKVLKCPNTAAHWFEPARHPDGPKIGVAVCEEHHRVLEEGEPYWHARGDNRLYMGSDFRVLTTVRTVERSWNADTFAFEVEYASGAEGTVFLSRDALRRIREIVNDWGLLDDE